MSKPDIDYLQSRLGEDNFRKLERIDNPSLYEFISKYVRLMRPDRIFVATDDPSDIDYVKQAAIRSGEERKLKIEGHTIHFDNYYDQARDKDNTVILVESAEEFGPAIKTDDRSRRLEEIHQILKDIMKGHELFVMFFCLGPTNSEFSIPCVQLTDSSYVAHSEEILYRQGYKEFVRQGRGGRFFKFVHSQGELDENRTSKNLDKRRIYIDLKDEIVFSANTQYGGNTIGLKKLAMRLAIHRGSREGWLTEHMLIMGVHGPGGRVTYFTGAFPSLCGKTSTAMLEGETIVGDDIAYLRKKDGVVRAVNVEKGMFGIIMGINSQDDPLQWKALHKRCEVIFSNVLVTSDGGVHWIGKDGEVPLEGMNHSGRWWRGKKDKEGREIPCSHPNARFTIALKELENLDPQLDNPRGVVVGAMVYGGRDSDTSPPVEESFDWLHGIVTKGASQESETTAATLGREGVRKFNPMSNLDFLSIPVGRYIKMNLEFGKGLEKPPLIFGVNYFLKDERGSFLNEKNDKKVWYKWMELRVWGDVGFIETPTGRIPKFEDLKKLFKDVLNKDYTLGSYREQFKVRVKKNLEKIDRILNIYNGQIPETPKEVFIVLEEQRSRLENALRRFGEFIYPEQLIKKVDN